MTQVKALSKTTILPLLAALVVLLAAADSSALAAGRTARCADVTATGGAYLAQQVRASGITCKSLRGKLRSWTRHGAASLPKGAGGWRCRRLAARAGTYQCSRRGHSSRATFAVLRDRTAPAIALASPVDGAQYDLGASVSVAYVCTDNGEVATCAGTAPNGSALPTSVAGAQSFTVTATDKAGNRAARTVSYTVVDRREPPRDTTAPTIELRSPANGAKYPFGSDVRAEFSCADNVGVASCTGTLANGAAIPTDALGPKTFSVTAKDAAGNVTVKQVTYTVTDAKPPTITLSAPVAGASFTWNQSVTVDYACADDAALATCVGTVGGRTVADGSRLPTSGAPGPGTRTLTVEASDKSGNVTTKSVQYTVQPAGYYGLTFDDGPNGLYTQPMLAELAKVNAKATFFLVGTQVQDFPELARALVAGGHSLQNHTMTHANLGPTADPTDPTVPAPTTDPAGEMSRASDAIQAVGAPKPTFLRPPYGMYDATTRSLAVSQGLEITNWTTETSDYTGISASAIAANAMAVPNRGIILMHDSNPNTVAAVSLMVNRLRDERGMLPGRLQKSATPQFISGWEDAGDGLGFNVEAVAP